MYRNNYIQCANAGFRQTLLICYQGKGVDQLERLAHCLESYPRAQVVPHTVCITAQPSGFEVIEDRIDQWVQAGHSKGLLGCECDRVIFDLNEIRADDLAIGTGLIPAGGLCILLQDLTQPLNAVAQRLLRQLEQQGEPHFCVIDLANYMAEPDRQLIELPPFERGLEQQQHLIDELVRHAKGRARRPLLVSADRGRGKTSALGLAAAQILPRLQSGQNIILVAKHESAVASAFKFAQQSLLQLDFSFTHQKNSIQLGENRLQFIVAAELFNREIQHDNIVWVDEAASLPVACLKRVLLFFKRSVFISTIQGYEGTGKGFELKFKPFLAQYSQQYKQIHLTQALRWQTGDPLEQACQQALLLNASVDLEAQLASPSNVQPSTCVSKLSFEHLIIADWFAADAEFSLQQEQQLKQLWGLLSLAHYQTSPMDLQLLLEDNSMQLLLAYQADELVGVILFKQEGQIEPELADQIALAKRRPKGHLLPQVFASQIGLTDALSLTAWRVIRIATRMDKVRQGIASSLLTELQNKAFEQRVDYLGSSFAATSEVIQFWRKNDYLPIHLGRQKDQASGCYALAVSLPLGSLAAELAEQAYRQFHQTWPLLLNEYWQDLDNASLIALAVQDQFKSAELDALSKKQVELFSQNQLSFEAAFGALVQVLVKAMAEGELDRLESLKQDVLIDKVLRSQAWACVSEQQALAGKKACLQQLQASFLQLI